MPKADAVGAALARMVGVVGQQLDFLHLHQLSGSADLPPLHQPQSQYADNFSSASSPRCTEHRFLREPPIDARLESSDFGWVTGVEKTVEAEEAAKAFGVDVQTAKRLIKHPLYCYPGRQFVFRSLCRCDRWAASSWASANRARWPVSIRHSSTLRALMIYLDPRPFHEAFTEFSDYKEGQDNVVLLTYEKGNCPDIPQRWACRSANGRRVRPG